jgi:hypothetical protein
MNEDMSDDYFSGADVQDENYSARKHAGQLDVFIMKIPRTNKLS